MIDVTIIIPVYNAAKYIEKCLNSLVNQNYDEKKIEIIAMDDCSTDNSLRVLEEYSKKYENIHIKSFEKNKGVSFVRNTGIQMAQGEFLLFCDADDFYESNAISTLMNVAKEKNADFVLANYFITNDKASIEVSLTNKFSTDQISKKEIISYMSLTSCAKLIKKSLFTENNILYSEDLKNCEELPVIPLVAYYAKKPIAVKSALYHYYQRKNSASNNNRQFKDIKDLCFFDIALERFLEKIDDKQYQEEIEFRTIEHLLYGKTLVMLKAKMNTRDITKHIESIQKKYPQFQKNKYYQEFNFSKKIFIWLLVHHCIAGASILAKIHTLITG